MKRLTLKKKQKAISDNISSENKEKNASEKKVAKKRKNYYFTMEVQKKL